MLRRLSILFLIALPVLGSLAIIAFAQGPMAATDSGTVDISHSICTTGYHVECGACKVDTGTGSNCYVTTCPDSTVLPKEVCIASTSIGPCSSISIVFQKCGSDTDPGQCTTWNCGVVNPAGPGHPNPYCDIGTCNCRGGGGSLCGSWSNWRGC
jgi:hypothetical protein